MRPLRYSINATLDGCVHHDAGLEPDAETMRFWADQIAQADALILGRVTYQMMESAWRKPASGDWPDWVEDWHLPFAEAMDGARKHVVSSTLESVDWNGAELLRGELGPAVERLKAESGEGLWVGGVTLPCALARLGLVDEIELLVHPVIAGHGPTLLSGLEERIRLEPLGREEHASGAVAARYRVVPA
ncbi:dihydrofolate reductase family protein [Homoserinibacter sp. YIM 151385]|uniref:dihydrofolate reductase family protein n=1 Tax=Homoserinibacter sp. YIM 151385 TaxID=2985506 RepID=UPI0022F012C1|nr:dihydrofolate reductase family protein [Homoserinibacter sp. YIM 151385]WBU38188.1 dihydrofolate reductase family protein [Homoserinibacter sp. YIM 151385]